MTVLVSVPDGARGAVVSATGRISHRCPHRAEFDQGSAVISWVVTDVTLELHSLTEYLEEWWRVSISHEELTRRIAEDVRGVGVAKVYVETHWHTAGMPITVKATSKKESK